MSEINDTDGAAIVKSSSDSSKAKGLLSVQASDQQDHCSLDSTNSNSSDMALLRALRGQEQVGSDAEPFLTSFKDRTDAGAQDEESNQLSQENFVSYSSAEERSDVIISSNQNGSVTFSTESQTRGNRQAEAADSIERDREKENGVENDIHFAKPTKVKLCCSFNCHLSF